MSRWAASRVVAHQAQGVYDELPDDKSKAAMRNVVLRIVAGGEAGRRADGRRCAS